MYCTLIFYLKFRDIVANPFINVKFFRVSKRKHRARDSPTIKAVILKHTHKMKGMFGDP